MKKHTTDVYDKIALSGAKDLKATSEISSDYIKSFFNGLPKNSSVLDIGPGKGAESKIAVNLGHRVTGLDISSEMAKIYEENVPGAKCIVSNMTEIPEGVGQFNALISLCSLLHLDLSLIHI